MVCRLRSSGGRIPFRYRDDRAPAPPARPSRPSNGARKAPRRPGNRAKRTPGRYRQAQYPPSGLLGHPGAPMAVKPAWGHWPGGGAAAPDRRTPAVGPLCPLLAPPGASSVLFRPLPRPLRPETGLRRAPLRPGHRHRPAARHERGRPPAHPAAPPPGPRAARRPAGSAREPPRSPRRRPLPHTPATRRTAAARERGTTCSRCRPSRRPPARRVAANAAARAAALCRRRPSLTPRRPAARQAGPGDHPAFSVAAKSRDHEGPRTRPPPDGAAGGAAPADTARRGLDTLPNPLKRQHIRRKHHEPPLNRMWPLRGHFCDNPSLSTTLRIRSTSVEPWT